MFVSVNKLANQLPKDKPDNRAAKAKDVNSYCPTQVKVACWILSGMADRIEGTFDQLRKGYNHWIRFSSQ
jgi:hypothetical protein